MKIREEILKMSPYVPSQLSGGIRLDTNENLIFPNQSFLTELKKRIDLDTIRLYPRKDAREKLAEHFECDSTNILITNGCAELLDLVAKCILQKGDTMACITPYYLLYKTIADCYGAELKTASNFEGLIGIEADLYIVSSPNNPTGEIISNQTLENLLQNGKAVIVDEAYAEFGKESFIHLVSKYDNLIITRSFSKAFGLAGLRIGAAIANENLINVISKAKIAWSVNSIAIEALLLALERYDEIKEANKIIQTERERMAKALGIPQSHGNFIFFNPPNKDEIAKALQKKEILIRNFDYGIRITVGKPEINNIVLETVLNSNPL